MVDPITITVATLLASKAVEALGGKVGEGLWAGIGRLAGLVREKLGGDSAGAAALERLEANPQDRTAVERLAGELDRHAAADPDFHQQLTALVEEARRDPKAGQFVTNVYGNAQVGKLVNIGDVQGNVSF
jgi:hypothetical protein